LQEDGLNRKIAAVAATAAVTAVVSAVVVATAVISLPPACRQV
jgi:hypothetical protein